MCSQLHSLRVPGDRGPIKVCIIGAGGHSRSCHLPALQLYQARHPGRVELAGIADRDRALAEVAAGSFGAGRAYVDLEAMLQAEQPDACLALASVEHNARVAIRLMERGLPALIEKPLGVTMAEARRVVSVAERTGARVMVSMNRRFDPLLNAALTWINGRSPSYVRASMLRHDRREEHFLAQTGVHVVDALRKIAGDVYSWRAEKSTVDGTRWTQIGVVFENGIRGLIDLMPTAGSCAETYEIFGADYRAEIQCSETGASRWRGWESGRLVCDESTAAGTPAYVSNGTAAETEAFFGSLLEGRSFYPSPADVLSSMELCHLAGQDDETCGWQPHPPLGTPLAGR
ncbi:MAG: hypothetical protein K0R17_2499 [Rariglobus sp.]|jgi:predicted dehydrogenase|nr:hypothetical protein [Rariglobus sp.]